MKTLSYLIVALFFVSCNGGNALEVSVNEIDAYVEDKLSDSQIYDVSQSLRFSRDNETYEVVQYMQNDSIILYLETHITKEEQVIRQIFFKNGLPVYVGERIGSSIAEIPFTERKTYIDGADMESYEKAGEDETDLSYIDFGKEAVETSVIDFEKPENAMLQKGEFEMVFEEFIVVDQTYLILENKKSEFDVALFVNEAHPLLDVLFAVPTDYEGRTIFVTHQFISMNGVNRMLFVDGFFTDEVD